MVRQDHLHRAEPNRLRDVAEGDGDHVGRQRHPREARDLAHLGKAADGILEILEQALEQRHHATRGGDRPAAVGIDAQGVIGKGAAQGAQRLDLELRLEHAALELDRAEAVLCDHAPRLLDHLRVGEHLAPGIRRHGGIVVAREFVEEIGAVGHALAHRTAEEIAQANPRRLSLQVEERDLEGAERRSARLVAGSREDFARLAAA